MAAAAFCAAIGGAAAASGGPLGATLKPTVQLASLHLPSRLRPSFASLETALPPEPSLAGRTLSISAADQIVLGPHEVILTFDDGPTAKYTMKILKILDTFGVKATFMMVGEMAQAHPEIARKVAEDGNTIGSHTFKHPDLDKMSFDMAMAEIQRGENAVVKATGTDVNFFRFPYLADSRKLRAAVAMRDLVVMDVDIDSKDYFTSTPLSVTQRTMNLLHKRGRGIILMHDIHQRTALMLPRLLDALIARHYTVVQLVYRNAPMVQLRTAGQE